VFCTVTEAMMSVEDCVTDNRDAPSQFSYATTFRRSGGSAREEAMCKGKVPTVL